MVNKENMRKWVEALRSGEFQQGKHFLAQASRNGWRYCCLGVACEAAVRDGLGLKVSERSDESSIKIKFYGQMGDSAGLPLEVVVWLGVTDNNPHVHQDLDGPVAACNANDVFDWSFEQIANAIEKHYELDKE